MILKGRNKYLPPIILEELDTVKEMNKLNKDVEGFEALAQYARVGREVERLNNAIFGGFGKKRRR